jgi:hypothetical protein
VYIPKYMTSDLTGCYNVFGWMKSDTKELILKGYGLINFFLHICEFRGVVKRRIVRLLPRSSFTPKSAEIQTTNHEFKRKFELIASQLAG